MGSRNVGTLNVAQQMGWVLGSVVLAGDGGKGALAVWMARRLGLSDWSGLLAGLAAIVGHNYPLFLSFRGGKGLATGLGVLLMLMPGETAVAMLLLGFIYLVISASVSAGAIVSLIFLSGLAAWRGQSTPLVVAPWAVLLAMGTRALPEAWRVWVSSPDKRELILHGFLFPRRAKEPVEEPNPQG
jgi:glycerol-3-phosphate acyltransferase PlsY